MDRRIFVNNLIIFCQVITDVIDKQVASSTLTNKMKKELMMRDEESRAVLYQ